MNDDRVIGYLRSRGQVEPEPELLSRIMAAVDAAPAFRSSFMTFLPAVGIAGVVAIVAVVAVLIGQDSRTGPGPTGSAEAVPSPATLEELRGALEAGVAALRAAPGVEGIATSSVRGELSGATWFSWRPNGDQVVITRSDVDVTETGWWMDPDGSPPARGEHVNQTIHVFVGDESFTTDAGGWVSQPRAAGPTTVSIATGVLDGEVDVDVAFVGDASGDVTVAREGDGGTTWMLVAPYRDGAVTSEWQIDPDGSLVSWSFEFVDVTPTVEDAPFVTSHRTEFTPLTDPAPIAPPDSQPRPDSAALGLPAGFPLGAGTAPADVDYVEYVEAALEVMEAYHWNSESIDWVTARAAALNGLPDAPSADQAHQRIRNATQTFDLFGTVFVRPADVPTENGAPGSAPGPSGERLGAVGYLHLPPLSSGGSGGMGLYLRTGRNTMAEIETTGPACGWIVDVREVSGGAYPPLFGVIGGLLGDGRVLTFDSALGDYWVEINDGSVDLGGEERSDPNLDSAAFRRATAEDELQAAEFAAAFERESSYQPGEPDAPVVVLTSNGTAAAGEQLVASFRGRPATRVIGGVTAGSPHGLLQLEMVDGARLRIPVATLVDRTGAIYSGSLVPDEVAAITGPDADAAIDAAVEWLEGQPGCS